jgi:hypothetical protein
MTPSLADTLARCRDGASAPRITGNTPATAFIFVAEEFMGEYTDHGIHDSVRLYDISMCALPSRRVEANRGSSRGSDMSEQPANTSGVQVESGEETDGHHNIAKANIASVPADRAGQQAKGPYPLDKFGMGPLHYAAMADDAPRVLDILKTGEEHVDRHDKYQRTPLHIAAFTGSLSACRALLAANASTDSVSLDGKSPLNCAAEEGHSEVYTLLAAQSPLHEAGSLSSEALRLRNAIPTAGGSASTEPTVRAPTSAPPEPTVHAPTTSHDKAQSERRSPQYLGRHAGRAAQTHPEPRSAPSAKAAAEHLPPYLSFVNTPGNSNAGRSGGGARGGHEWSGTGGVGGATAAASAASGSGGGGGGGGGGGAGAAPETSTRAARAGGYGELPKALGASSNGGYETRHASTHEPRHERAPPLSTPCRLEGFMPEIYHAQVSLFCVCVCVRA